jgi:hypothetical protein
MSVSYEFTTMEYFKEYLTLLTEYVFEKHSDELYYDNEIIFSRDTPEIIYAFFDPPVRTRIRML